MKSGGNQAKSILEIDKFTIVWGKWSFIRVIFRFEILEAKQKFGEKSTQVGYAPAVTAGRLKFPPESM